MHINKNDSTKLFLRKPTDNEQRNGKIVTSDYAISAITIYSSVLKTLGFIDKVYRSKEAIIKYSNKKQITTLKKDLIAFSKIFPKHYTTKEAWYFNENCQEWPNFIKMIQDTQPNSWKGLAAPEWIKTFKTPKSFLKAEKYARSWQSICESEILDGMSEYFCSNITISDFNTLAFEYFEKIKCDSVKGRSLPIINSIAYNKQLEVEKEIGKNFTPKKLAFLLAPSTIDEIEREWELRIDEFEGTWEDLANHIYSPSIINKIRETLGVNVRSRTKGQVRKGTEFFDRQRLTKAIATYEKRLGCSVDAFNEKDEMQKIENTKNDIALLEVQYAQSLIAKNFAKKNNDVNYETISNASDKLRNKLNYLKNSLAKKKETLNKKIDAYNTVKEYIRQNEELTNFIEQNRTWEEISEIKESETINAIRKQKNEKAIPYCTWRFVCDKIDSSIAQKIERILEENLNKGSGVNGEDGYVNVTSFPMEKSYEFFVDYPKSSNMFKAFKNKGKSLSKILIEGVAHHLGIKFVCCEGETYVNSPMEKTMGGDMLEWVGI